MKNNTLLKDITRIAKKDHISKCIWCGEAPKKGEEYHEIAHICDGDFVSYKIHSICNKELVEEVSICYDETMTIKELRQSFLDNH